MKTKLAIVFSIILTMISCAPSIEISLPKEATSIFGINIIPENITHLTGIVRSEKGSFLEGVGVAVPLGERVFDTETDSSGAFLLQLPRYEIPRNFLVLFYQAGYAPKGLNVTYEEGGEIIALNASIEEAKPNQVFIDQASTLHHLGDDNYSGSYNSKLQKGTEGTSFKTAFPLTEEQRNAGSFQLTLLAKGLERDNPLLINGQRVGALNSSASSGEFTELSFPIPVTALITGNNTLSIQSFLDSSINDYDDFEFTNISLELAGLDVDPIPSIQCPLEQYDSGINFTGTQIWASPDFFDSLAVIDQAAGQAGVKIFITQAFRLANQPVKGAIVSPAKKSNHLVGHAIDMNVQYIENNKTKLCNSSCLSGTLPAPVANFIKSVKSSGLRWGEDFSDKDPVHFDDNYNANLSKWEEKFEIIQKCAKDAGFK